MGQIISAKPLLSFVEKTDSVRQDSDVTYNSAIATYSSSDVKYGGVGLSLSAAPFNLDIFAPVPNMQLVYQFSETRVTLYAGMPMGLLLALTYPTEESYIV